MDHIFQLTMLYDFYSELLTPKQRLFFELYHFDDWSLNEIGEEQGISPQAVRDLIKRTEKILFDYESKLKLIEKHQLRAQKIEELQLCLNGLTDRLDEETDSKLKNLLLLLKE